MVPPHGLATGPPPKVLAPKTEPGIWFHDLPALATLRGTIIAVDAGATPVGMAMVGVAQCGPGAYQAHVASGVHTSQEGEAMILLSYVRRLAVQSGVNRLVPDSEAAMGALCTYQEGGHCGDGIHHLYATILGGNHLVPTSSKNGTQHNTTQHNTTQHNTTQHNTTQHNTTHHTTTQHNTTQHNTTH